MKITKIHYNWHYCIDLERECSSEAEVGKKGVISITLHLPENEGEKIYCDVEYEDDTSEMIFNLNKVFRKKND